MKAVPLPMVRFRLGAEELIELGRPASPGVFRREPFLAGRAAVAAASPAPYLGAVRRDAGAFIADALERGTAFLDGMVRTPSGLLASGADAVAAGAADLLRHVPALGCVMVQVLLLGSAALKFPADVPGAPGGLVGLLAGLSRALASAFGAGAMARRVEDAETQIINRAPGNLQAAVARVLDATVQNPPAVPTAGGPVLPPAAGPLPPLGTATAAMGTPVLRALAVGIPAAGAAVLAAAFG